MTRPDSGGTYCGGVPPSIPSANGSAPETPVVPPRSGDRGEGDARLWPARVLQRRRGPRSVLPLRGRRASVRPRALSLLGVPRSAVGLPQRSGSPRDERCAISPIPHQVQCRDDHLGKRQAAPRRRAASDTSSKTPWRVGRSVVTEAAAAVLTARCETSAEARYGENAEDELTSHVDHPDTSMLTAGSLLPRGQF
jgi:hypothetical protein